MATRTFLTSRSTIATATATAASQSLLPITTAINSVLQTLTHQNQNSLNQFSQNLTPDLVVQVIKSQTNPQTALFFFNWASNPNPNPKNYSHTQRCYSTIVHLLISHSLFTTAANLLQSSNQLSDFFISKFIKACGDLGDIRGAIYWFNRAYSIESGRCFYSYNAVLSVLVRSNRITLATAFFNQIVREGVVKPDVSTYTIMIRGYCKLGMIQDAKMVFDEMHCRPNLITYNTIIAGFCRKGDVKNAREILDQMDCSPDTITFTTLIDGYCKQNKLEEAEKCLEEMVQRKCEPNVLTYNSLINGLCLNSKIEDGKRMMTKMRLNGLKDDVATHTSLLKGLCIVGKGNDAAKHLKEMVSLGMNPDEKAYAVVVTEFCKMRRPAEAMVILDEMKMRGITPSVSSFNSLFRVLCELGELDSAIRVLKEMLQRGCSPNFLSYNSIICRLCSVGGRMRDVEDLIVDMTRSSHRPDATMYSTMVTGYCEDGDLHMATGIFCEMMEKSFVIHPESFSVLVKVLCGKGKASEAKRLFEDMIRKCPISNVDEYRSILNEHLCNLWADLPARVLDYQL